MGPGRSGTEAVPRAMAGHQWLPLMVPRSACCCRRERSQRAHAGERTHPSYSDCRAVDAEVQGEAGARDGKRLSSPCASLRRRPGALTVRSWSPWALNPHCRRDVNRPEASWVPRVHGLRSARPWPRGRSEPALSLWEWPPTGALTVLRARTRHLLPLQPPPRDTP